MGAPFAIFWFFYTDNVISWLSWGDEAVAQHAIEFARIYIFSRAGAAVQLAFNQLLDVAGQEIFTTVIGLAEQAVNVGILLFLCLSDEYEVTLVHVAWIYVVSTSLFLGIMLVISHCSGWLKPFKEGLFGSLAFLVSS
jgi:Na+-driven multidrug efflux pump